MKKNIILLILGIAIISLFSLGIAQAHGSNQEQDSSRGMMEGGMESMGQMMNPSMKQMMSQNGMEEFHEEMHKSMHGTKSSSSSGMEGMGC